MRIAHLARAAALSAGAVIALAAPTAATAAITNTTTVPWTCEVTGGTGIPGIPASAIQAKLTYSLKKITWYYGERFTLDDVSMTLTIDPAALRPQVVATDGVLAARLDELQFVVPESNERTVDLATPSAPVDLGSIDNRIDLAPRFAVPPGDKAYPSVGPFTVANLAGALTPGMSKLGLTLTLSRPGQQTFAAITTSVSCTSPVRAFIKLPVNGPNPGPPSISGLSPTSGPGGTKVTITGSGFTDATGLDFGGNPVPVFKVVSDTEIQATVPTLEFLVPPPPTLAWDVSVTTPAGTSANTAADDFTYLTGTAASGPQVRQIWPGVLLAATGGIIHVRGIGFTGATAVLIGGSRAPFLRLGDRDLIALAAPRAAGKYPVVVEAPTGSSPLSARGILTFR